MPQGGSNPSAIVSIEAQIQSAIATLTNAQILQMRCAHEAAEKYQDRMQQEKTMKPRSFRTAWSPKQHAMMHALEDLHEQAEAAEKSCASIQREAQLACAKDIGESEEAASYNASVRSNVGLYDRAQSCSAYSLLLSGVEFEPLSC